MLIMALISVISSISFFFNKPSSPLPTTFNDSNLFLILQAKVASVRIILMVFFFFFNYPTDKSLYLRGPILEYYPKLLFITPNILF